MASVMQPCGSSGEELDACGMMAVLRISVLCSAFWHTDATARVELNCAPYILAPSPLYL